MALWTSTDPIRLPCFSGEVVSWGGRIRTSESRLQRPLPYHLATPHRKVMAVSPIFYHIPQISATEIGLQTVGFLGAASPTTFHPFDGFSSDVGQDGQQVQVYFVKGFLGEFVQHLDDTDDLIRAQ
jgi:hypothetical protein